MDRKGRKLRNEQQQRQQPRVILVKLINMVTLQGGAVWRWGAGQKHHEDSQQPADSRTHNSKLRTRSTRQTRRVQPGACRTHQVGLLNDSDERSRVTGCHAARCCGLTDRLLGWLRAHEQLLVLLHGHRLVVRQQMRRILPRRL